MKRYLIFALPLQMLFSSSCNDDDNTIEEYREKQTIRFVELAYGPSSRSSAATNETDDAQTSSDEVHSFDSDFTVAENSDTISAKLGTKFGVRYMLESNLDPSVELRQVWVFPDSMRNDDGDVYIEDSYRIHKEPNTETYAAYTLDYPYEVKKGKWQLCFYYKKHLLYRKIFVLI